MRRRLKPTIHKLSKPLHIRICKEKSRGQLHKGRKMGNQKLKWTAEEEQALLAGITKHGQGKWKNILRDPEFAHKLINRSNIDLKDKWRNLSVAPSNQGSNNRARPTRVIDEGVALPAVAAGAITTPAPSANSSSFSAASLSRSASSELINDDSSNIAVDTKNAPRHDGLIFEALSALANEDGSDVTSVFNYIESKPSFEMPPNFRRMLGSRLRRLAGQNKLVKSQNFYKLPDPSGTRTPAPRPRETHIKPRQSNNQTPAVSQHIIEEAARSAAYKVVEAENKIDVAKVAVEELEKMTKLAEETEHFLEIAKEIHEQCSRGEVVLLA